MGEWTSFRHIDRYRLYKSTGVDRILGISSTILQVSDTKRTTTADWELGDLPELALKKLLPTSHPSVAALVRPSAQFRTTCANAPSVTQTGVARAFLLARGISGAEAETN